MHTVEKIGGSSMSRVQDVLNNIWLHKCNNSFYNRIFVVSAYAGVTDLLLEHKKSGDAGVYSCFAEASQADAWRDRLTDVQQHLLKINQSIFQGESLQEANDFIEERIKGADQCMQSLHDLCLYGHFQLDSQLATVREMLASIGEVHSAFNSVLLLKENGINARLVDLTGWHLDAPLSFEEMIKTQFSEVNPAKEIVITTGYTHCKEGLMKTFDRGYSEMTFSKIATVTGAAEAIIHKEFHLSSADPRIVGVDKVITLGMTNFDVADQLSNLGMEAIHPKAARGLRHAGIQLRIKNTFEPDHNGTLISNDYQNPRPCVEIIAGRRDVFGIEVFDQDMLGTSEHDINITRLLHHLKLDLVNKEADANSITYFTVGNRKKINRAVRLIEEAYPAAEVAVRNIAMVSAIGSDIKVKGMLAKTVSALTNADISILSLHQTQRQVEMQCIVADKDYENAIKVLHKALIEAEDHGEVIRRSAA
ncbi:aspartate kinase [Neptunomonas antarctica]|uniref:aspartate kinase n=1 Tax=Neptunomonas antarctica TaxID=619304 RepID=A0A1N7N8Q2_9GAMM|nr:aspartate kinase [Neptunomonas antarctica]SIS94725.1 aspartate kinase [Neptunomonas antarctica]